MSHSKLIGLCTLLLACDATGAIPAEDVVNDQTIVPDLTTIETVVTPANINAGESVTVTCNGKDQLGAAFTPNLPITFEVFDAHDQMPEGITIDGDRVTAQFAGVVRVRCYYPGTPRIEDGSPISLTVQPGPATSVKTTILKTELVAGDKVTVNCSVRDALDNTTAGATELRIVPDTGTTVMGGKTVRFTKVGTFGVTCALVDGDLVGNQVDVHVTPADLAVLETVLSTSSITPTQEVTVTCPGRDAYDNPIALEKVITLPVPNIQGLDTDRLRITGTLAGTYPITCAPKEAFIKASRNPAELTITAGAPASLTMDLDPDRTVYSLGVRPKVTARLYDQWGNEVSDVSAVTVTTRNGGALRETTTAGERVTLDAEGSWTITVTAPGGLTASRTVVVDASAPTIDITFPERGEFVTNDGTPITVTGVIADANGGLQSLKVNGVARQITAGTNRYDLAMQVLPQHGLNTLTVEATDVQGQVVRIAQSYMVGPDWKSAAENFPEGIVAHLTRAFIDDGNRQGRADDLATIIERVAQSFDIASYIPSPAVQNAGYDVYLRNLDYDPPKVTLTPSRDRLLMHLDITNMSIDVDAEGFIDVSGVISVDAIRVDVQLGVTVQAGVPKVTPLATVVIVEGLDIDVHWSINWLIDLFTDTIREQIVTAFEDVLRDEIPPVVQDALGSLALDETFEVPGFLPGMSPLNVRLQAKTNNAILDEQGLSVGLATQVTAARRVQWETPGSITRGGCFGVDGGMPTWDSAKKLTMALSLDVLNQVLHAVWQGGALEMELGADAFGDADLTQYGVSDLTVDISARMPPALTDCQANTLVVQMGELHLDASLKLSGMPLKVDMIVAFQTEANVTVDGNGVIALALGEILAEDIVIDITHVESELFTDQQEDVLITLLREQLLVKVLGDFGGQGLADFPLPEFDLSGLAPELAGQVIAITDVTLGRKKGYLLLQGNP